jgi:hypothetical protein
MKVKAKTLAFVDGCRVKPGAVIAWPEDKEVPEWLEVVEAAPKAVPKPKAKVEPKADELAG